MITTQKIIKGILHTEEKNTSLRSQKRAKCPRTVESSKRRLGKSKALQKQKQTRTKQKDNN